MEIGQNFFMRDAQEVARDLLGKEIVRKEKEEYRARIVETEAYFDEKDPASRARQNGKLREIMKGRPGTILVYGVHNNWLLNIVTGEKDKAEAVLIRAIEPLNFKARTKGPGLLTEALKIDKSFNAEKIGENIKFEQGKDNFKIESGKRIGVSEDLDKDLRFWIKNNEFVSR